MKRRWMSFCLTALLGLVGSGCAPAPTAPTAPPLGTTDHHVHLLGPGLLRDWKTLGARFSRADAAYLGASALLEGAPGAPAAVERVVLVPMAHLYGNSEFRAGLGLSLDEEHRRAAAENDHVAREAARHPARAVALCSVSVLRPWAWDELQRCRRDLGSAGLKLHLASSEVDLREPAHRAEVVRLAAWAEQEGLPILLHLDTQRRGTNKDHVEQFLREALEPHPKLVVIIAHLGGSGGYGRWTRQVFQTVLGWVESRHGAGAALPAVYFDVSAVLLEAESEGVPATTAEEAANLGADLRRAGFERLLLGSDYPVFQPQRTLDLLRERAGLTEAELARLRTNRAPGLGD